MSPASSFSSRTGSRTFRSACVILSGVALVQGLGLAVAWSDFHQIPSWSVAHVPPVREKEKSPPPSLPPEAEPDPFASDAPFEDKPVETAGTTGPVENVTAAGEPKRMSVPSRPAGEKAAPAEAVVFKPEVKSAPLDSPITDEACLRHFDEGIYLRSRGEMQGALTELRAALALNPDHPQLLYQTARTYDLMIQERKSVVLWEKLRKLGPDAGNCYQLAVARLKELSGVSPAAPGDEPEEKGGRFVLGDMTVERLADTTNGEVLRFHASVKHLQPDAVDVNKIWMKLHLFDIVNGQHIDRTTAVVAVPNWLDKPVDWADGTESFEFEYRQPPLSVDEIVKLGQRKYYGYAVELRYGDEGQLKFEDMMAEPRELGDFARELPEETAPAPAGAMDGPVPAGKTGQPDGTLFPGDKFDR